jgi:hypothetical protein
VVEQSFSSADQTSDEESAAASLFEQELAPALEEMPPQEADVELQAQLKSREDDVKAFDKWVAQRVWVAPPKPKPKSEVYIPPSPFPRDPSDEAYIETQDPSTAAPSSTDSGRLRSG